MDIYIDICINRDKVMSIKNYTATNFFLKKVILFSIKRYQDSISSKTLYNQNGYYEVLFITKLYSNETLDKNMNL